MKLPSDLSVFQMLETRLEMLGTRQKSVAENVANANTPGYVPNDVDMASFARVMERQTSPKVAGVNVSEGFARHFEGKSPLAPRIDVKAMPDSEVTADGNAVVVEEQMLKMSQVRADFDAAVTLYQKGLSLIRMAARSPN